MAEYKSSLNRTARSIRGRISSSGAARNRRLPRIVSKRKLRIKKEKNKNAAADDG